MAEYGKGVNYTKVIDPSSENIIDPGLIGGKVRVMQDYISIAATTLKSTDYVIVGTKLPTGSHVVRVILGVQTATATASSLLVVGDEADADRYITSTLLSSNDVTVGPNNANTGMYYAVTGTTDNYIRIAGAGTTTVVTGASIKISVLYTVE
jgi:hypothetical protein